MALNAITLVADAGYAGFSFSTALTGTTPGSSLSIRRESGDGFTFSNGVLANNALPSYDAVLLIDETIPGTGERKTSRVIVKSKSYYSEMLALSANNPENAKFSPVPVEGAGYATWGVKASFKDGTSKVVSRAFNKSIFRAVGTRVQLPYVTSGGAANQGFGFRINPFSPVPIKRFYLVLPTFHVDELTGNETDWAQDARIQFGIDELNTQSMSGLPVRGLVKFGGQNTATYRKATGPFSYIKSDVYEMSQPRNTFSIYLGKEWIGTPPDLKSPRNCVLSSVAGKYEKSEIFTTASGVSPIDSGWVINQTDIGAETLNGSGRLLLCPFIVAEMVDGTVSILILGTSSSRGVNEVSGPVTDSNPYGDVRGSRGWPAKYVGTKLNLPYANFGISGDQMAFILAGNNFQRRMALAKELNPSHCLFQHGANDIAAGASLATVISRAAQTMDKLRSVLPNLDFVPSSVQPSSTSSDNWKAVNGSDQTQNTAFNTNNAALNYDNLQRKGLYPFDGTYGPKGKYIETTIPLVNPVRNPNPLVACDYTWIATGTANDLTIDGRHMNTNAENRYLFPALSSVSPFVPRNAL